MRSFHIITRGITLWFIFSLFSSSWLALGNDAHYTMLLFLELMRRFKEANDKAECNLIDSLR